MTCDMTGGASGGPWFQEFDEGTGLGVLNSVNSYKINLIPTWMFGPYFGADAQDLYNRASAGLTRPANGGGWYPSGCHPPLPYRAPSLAR